MKTTTRYESLTGRPLFWMALTALATFVAYLPALQGHFTNWDDMVYVGANPYIQSLSLKNLAAIFSENFMGNYHPLAMLSLAVDYQINQFDPFYFHLTNLILHILNSILVLMVLRKLTDRLPLAAIAALLFGVHALHVESVAWISERKDVLYTLFYLLSLWFYLRYIREKGMKWFWVSLFFFLLSCLSKGQAVSLAVTLFLADIFLGRKWTEGKVLLEKIPFLAMALVFGIVAVRAQEVADATTMANFPIQQRFAFASYGLVMYILKLFVPFSLSAYYPYPITAQAGDVPFLYWLCLIPAAGMVTGWILSWKRSKPLFFGLGFFLVNIVLLLQLLPVGRAIMADRYAYVPSIGFFFLAGHYLTRLRPLQKPALLWGTVAVYTIILAAITFQRSKVWYSSDTLWTDAIKKNANVPVAWYNRGNTRMDSADYKGAIADYTECLKVDPGFWKAYINRGNARSKLKDYLGSIEDFDAIIRLDSTQLNPYINRAMSRRMLMDFENAMKDYDKAIRMKPDQMELYTSRANLKLDMKNYDGAIADLMTALKLKPDRAGIYASLAIVKKAKGDRTGALADYDHAIGLDAGNSELFNNRGNLKYQLGDAKGALDDYNSSIRLNPKDPLGYKNRALIRIAQKEFGEANKDLTEAIRMNPSSGELYYTRALARNGMQDADGAKTDYLKAVELDPTYAAGGFMKNAGVPDSAMPGLQPTQLNEQARRMEAAGKLQEAIALYREALGIKADMPETWFNLGNLYGKTNRLQDAMECLNNAIKYRPEYPQALSSRGIAYASMGKTELAVSDLSAAIRSDPAYAIAYYNRGLVYLNSGKRDLACPDFQKAVKLGWTAAYPVYKKECENK